MTLLPMVMLTTFTSCSKDDGVIELGKDNPDNDNNNGDNNNGDSQQNQEIIVTVDANGNADGGHRFTKIDDNDFYIDDIKYTAISGNLEVTGYDKAFFHGVAKIISTLNYEGRTLKVTAIAEKAFYQCSSLTSVTIPNSVKSIGDYAFSVCSNLTSIKVESENKKYDSRNNCNAIIETATNTLIAGCKNTNIPNSVTSIGFQAFYGCSSLTSITIPNSVTSIDNCAFEYCTGLTSIIIPNSVTSIGSFAFYECTSLTSVIIGNGVTSIHDQAFYCCKLTDVWCYAETVPWTYSNAFYASNNSSATLHVPAASISAYKTTAPWNGFRTYLGITTSVFFTTFSVNSTTGKYVVDSEYAAGSDVYVVLITEDGSIIIPTASNYKVYSVTSSNEYIYPITEASVAKSVANPTGNQISCKAYNKNVSVVTKVPGEDFIYLEVYAVKMGSVGAGTYAIEYTASTAWTGIYTKFYKVIRVTAAH